MSTNDFPSSENNEPEPGLIVDKDYLTALVERLDGVTYIANTNGSRIRQYPIILWLVTEAHLLIHAVLPDEYQFKDAIGKQYRGFHYTSLYAGILEEYAHLPPDLDTHVHSPFTQVEHHRLNDIFKQLQIEFECLVLNRPETSSLEEGPSSDTISS